VFTTQLQQMVPQIGVFIKLVDFLLSIGVTTLLFALFTPLPYPMLYPLAGCGHRHFIAPALRAG
jgi:hypothetical protein